MNELGKNKKRNFFKAAHIKTQFQEILVGDEIKQKFVCQLEEIKN